VLLGFAGIRARDDEKIEIKPIFAEDD